MEDFDKQPERDVQKVYEKVAMHPDHAVSQAVLDQINPIVLLLKTRQQIEIGGISKESKDPDFLEFCRYGNGDIRFYNALLKIFMRAKFARHQSAMVFKHFISLESALSDQQIAQLTDLFNKALDAMYGPVQGFKH